jgi:hypothetical protein
MTESSVGRACVWWGAPIYGGELTQPSFMEADCSCEHCVHDTFLSTCSCSLVVAPSDLAQIYISAWVPPPGHHGTLASTSTVCGGWPFWLKAGHPFLRHVLNASAGYAAGQHLRAIETLVALPTQLASRGSSCQQAENTHRGRRPRRGYYCHHRWLYSPFQQLSQILHNQPHKWTCGQNSQLVCVSLVYNGGTIS